MSKLIFKCSNISKSFYQGNKTVEVLKNIDFTLEQSTSVSIVGPSGSGKTTFLNVLSGLDSPSAGKVFYKEKDINNLNDKERASIRNKEIGFVYQFHHLLPEFTALENVSLPMLISGLNMEEANEKSSRLLKKVNLENRMDHKPSELSGGEQQRVGVARAVVHRPAVLLADEPTGNLDKKTAIDVMSVLLEYIKEVNGAMLLVTHDEEIANMCNQKYYLKNGRLNV
jgi:lipoprotein-releasing system ATP-binding protein